jgi:hypothetical protein
MARILGIGTISTAMRYNHMVPKFIFITIPARVADKFSAIRLD